MSNLAIGGLQTALSRIDQIQSYQQQLLDPSAAATGASAATATGTTGTSAAATAATSAALTAAATSPSTASTGTQSSDFASLLSALQSTSPSSATSTVSGGAGLTSAPDTVQNMVSEADSLVGKPYVWGGGHTGWGAQSGYDCSGFVSAVLHAGGYLQTPQDTSSLPAAAGMASGPGQYVTVYDRTDPALGEGHVIIDLNGQFYESGGQAGSWGGGHGVMKIDKPSAQYLATFNTVLHPEGL